MELLLAAIVVIVTWLVRKVTGKLGLELGRALVLVTAFVLSGLAAWLYTATDQTFWVKLGTIFTTQIAFYEVIVKTILQKIFFTETPNP